MRDRVLKRESGEGKKNGNEGTGAIIKRNSYCTEPRLGEFLNVVRKRVLE